MDRWSKIQNIIWAVVFSIIGHAALDAVVFVGAVHQLAVVAISAAMVIMSITEIKHDTKKTDRKKHASENSNNN